MIIELENALPVVLDSSSIGILIPVSKVNPTSNWQKDKVSN